MTFVIIGYDAEDSYDKRPQHRDEHLKRLEELDREGKLIMAGPFTDKTGSLIVIEADSLEEAEAFAKNDPYFLHGIFIKVDVKPFNWVLPKK